MLKITNVYLFRKKNKYGRIVKNLVAANREGDWEAHLLAVQNILPIFREFDSINYLRYGSLYLKNFLKYTQNLCKVILW